MTPLLDIIPNQEGTVWDRAVERALHTYELHDHVIVMFSGGKDSTVTLHCAIAAARQLDRLPVRVVFIDEEAIPYQTEHYLRRMITTHQEEISLEWYCVPIEASNACSRQEPHWYPWAPEDHELWCRPLPPEGITDLPGLTDKPRDKRLPHSEINGLFFDPAEHGTVAIMFGIRGQESPTRQRAVRLRAEENYLIPDHDRFTRSYPIYDWTLEDVWTAPKLFGWDYNRAYDAMEMAGVSRQDQRLGPPYGNEPINILWMWRECFPEVWDKMIERAPGVPAAARYALTELYGAGHGIQKPKDMTWAEACKHYLAMHEPEARRQTAEVIRTLVRTHYRRTTDPITPRTPHPDSGCSWYQLLRIAMRGDPKKRRLVATTAKAVNPDHPDYQPRLKRHHAELEELRLRGEAWELDPEATTR